MSIVSSSEVIAKLGVSTYSAEIQELHEGIEQDVKDICGKPFESTSYFELYDGRGGLYRLPLNHVPVTSVARVSTDLQAVIKIKNTTRATTASVKVDATNVTLTIDTTTSTLAIATYTTLSSLVTAINLLSVNGWVAEIYHTDYNAKLTNKLIAQQLDVTSFDSTEDYNYLYMGEPVDFTFIPNINAVEAYFPYGSQNIGVNYTAGSTPASIKSAVLALIKVYYTRSTNQADGIKSYAVGDIRTEYYAGVEEISSIMGVLERNKAVTI